MNLVRNSLNAGRINHLFKRQFHCSSIYRAVDDPYKILGVDRNASAKDIKKQYYQLAKKFHPDVNKEEGADKKFQDIQESYEILSDETKRQQFDQFGSAAFNQAGGPGGPGGSSGPFNPFSQGGFNFDDIFGAFAGGQGFGGQGFGGQGFGGRTGGFNQVIKGDDIEVVARITLEQAAKGTASQVKYNAYEECSTCDGTGLKAGKKTATCSTCHGSGYAVHMMQGGFQMQSVCPTCKGSGVMIPASSRCSSCHGEGVKQETKTLKVDIPPGIYESARLRVVNEGDAPNVRKAPGTTLQNGDLYVRVHIEPHPKFRQVKDDLIYTAEIPFTTAILGGTIEVPTLDGPKIKLKVHSGSSSGNEMTIGGQGMPKLNTKRKGDLKVILKVKPFRPEDSTQTILLEALADSIKDHDARRLYPSLHEVKDDNPTSDKEPGLLKRLFNKLTKKD